MARNPIVESPKFGGNPLRDYWVNTWKSILEILILT